MTNATEMTKTLMGSWQAASRQRSQRTYLRISVRASGYTDQGARFDEQSQTSEVNPFGGSIMLSAPVNEGQRIVVTHAQTRKSVECLVVSSKKADGGKWLVGIAFTSSNPKFWLVSFPPVQGAVQRIVKSQVQALAGAVGQMGLCVPA